MPTDPTTVNPAPDDKNPAAGLPASPPAVTTQRSPGQRRGLSGFATEALKRAKAISASSMGVSDQSAVPATEAPAQPAAEGSGPPALEPKTIAPSGGGSGGQSGRPKGDRGPRRDQRGPRRDGGKPNDGSSDESRPSKHEFVPPPPVPIPSRRGPVSADLQAEIDEALGGLSLDDIVSGQSAPEPSAGRLPNESRHRGQVVNVHGDNVFVTLGGKNQGVCSPRNFAQPPEVGQMLDVVVTGFNAEDNLHDVNVPGSAIVAGDWGDISEGSLVEARVTGANTGGLECQVKNIRGFIPAGQLGIFRVENLGDYIDQKLVCVVMEANQGRGNLVLSRRAVLEREKEETKKKTMAELAPGQLREGIVRRLQDFGAFVDIGGVDGLIHISQLSWERVKHPSEILQEGQKIRVRIEKIDPQTGKIALSLKNPEEHPWTNIEQRFPVGSTVRGPVSRLAQFGAFVKLAPGVEGLIHISELAHHRVYRVENVVKEGEEVECKVLAVDAEQQRMSLSLKATLAKPVKEETGAKAVAEEPEAPPREPVIPKRSGPLRGGTGKGSGGDQFGLKW